VGEQQRVELLKMLYRDVRILILDEPTSVLTPGEVRGLFALLGDLARRGLAIVLITHKLREALEICTRITILRRGRRVATVPAGNVTDRVLARMMVGRELPPLLREQTTPGEPLLVVEGLCTAAHGRPGLRDLTFAVRGGEIVSVAGVDGNGQRELAEVLAGLRQPSSGRVQLDGRDITSFDPAIRRRLGLGFVPEDRTTTALALGLSIGDNAVLHVHAIPPLARWGIRDRAACAAYARRLLQEYDVRARGPDAPARTLSGGNQQKLVLARELDLTPRVLVAVQPTRGLDVVATEFVHARLLDARQQAQAVLLISTDLDEVLSLSDRILVMHGHRIVGEMAAGRVDIEELGLLMAGARKPTHAP